MLKGDGQVQRGESYRRCVLRQRVQRRLAICRCFIRASHRKSALDLFAFSRALPGRCVIVVDEIQNLLSRYAMASLKSQLFIQALAELRKKRITIIGITSPKRSS